MTAVPISVLDTRVDMKLSQFSGSWCIWFEAPGAFLGYDTQMDVRPCACDFEELVASPRDVERQEGSGQCQAQESAWSRGKKTKETGACSTTGQQQCCTAFSTRKRSGPTTGKCVDLFQSSIA